MAGKAFAGMNSWLNVGDAGTGRTVSLDPLKSFINTSDSMPQWHYNHCSVYCSLLT